MSNVEKIKDDLRSLLSQYRYLHSLRVADLSRSLAIVYGYDEKIAYLVGLIHDIAKEFSVDDNRKYVKYYHLSKDLLNDDYSKMIHADIGACIARDKYKFHDELCHAIACHTLGGIPMNLIDKILFVADKIEPFKDYEGIDEERRLASFDIDRATILCIENHHKKLIREKRKIFPKSLEVLEYLKNQK